MSTGHEDRDHGSRPNTSGRDQVSLSAQERESLAHLEQRLRVEDPEFALRLRGHSWQWLREHLAGLHLPVLPGWSGPTLVVVGLVATLWTVDTVVWLSVVTVGLMVVGAARVGQTVRARLAVRRTPATAGSDSTD